MKKLRLLALILVSVLTLSGCTVMLERSYSSSSQHLDYSITEDTSILRAESYQALVNSVLYFVGEHVGNGTIRLYNYSGNVDADLVRACAEVTEKDPLGSFAVHSIDYESTRILTYYEVKFHIEYRRTSSEVASIRSVSGQNGIRQAMETMNENRQSYAALRTAYFPGDAQLVSHLFWLSFYSTPAVAMDAPELAVSFYPEEGTQRILEVAANWLVSAGDLAEYRTDLTEASAWLLAETPAGEQGYTIQDLASILRDHVSYDPSGDHTALAAIQGLPVNDLGMLLAMEHLLQSQGIEVSAASDTAGAQYWLIVSTPSGYRHLLPRDLRPALPVSDDLPEEVPEDPQPQETIPPQTGDGMQDAPEDPSEPPAEPPPDAPDAQPAAEWLLPLYTDEELAALGFEWPRDLHPACVDYSGATPE